MIDPLANVGHAFLTTGANCRVDAFAVITGRVALGDKCHVGTGASILGGEGVEIGDETSVSPGARIFTATFDRETGHRANPQLGDGMVATRAPVKIGARCIVGTGSIVLPGTVMDDDVLIGALSLVKGHLTAGMYAGSPLRKI